MKESGYAGFNLLIDLYLKNAEEPKKISFFYDLSLQQTGPAIYKVQKEKYVFHHPNEEFRQRLIKGGAVLTPASQSSSSILNESSRDATDREERSQLVDKPKLGGDISRKHKQRPEETKLSNAFADLFGPPITKKSKISPEPKAPVKSIPAVVPDRSKTVEKVDKVKKHSPHKDRSKEKEHKKNKDERSRSKDKGKEKKREKSEETKREVIKSPKRVISPVTTPKKDSKHKHDDSKEKKSKKREKSKEKHREHKNKEEKPVEEVPKVKEVVKEVPKIKEPPKEVPKIKEKTPKPVEPPVKEKPVEEKVEKVEKVHKSDRHGHKHKKKDRDKSKKEEKKHDKKIDKIEITKVPIEEPKLPPPPPPDIEKENKNTNEVMIEKEKVKEPVEESIPTNSLKPVVEASPEKPKKSKKHKDKHKSGDKKKRERKSSKIEVPVEEEAKKEPIKDPEDEPEPVKETKVNGVKADEKEVVDEDDDDEVELIGPGDNMPMPFLSADYLTRLKELQGRIMSLQDNNELQQVVQLIAETGHYEVTRHSFNFDLCTLDSATVTRLHKFFTTHPGIV